MQLIVKNIYCSKCNWYIVNIAISYIRCGFVPRRLIIRVITKLPNS